MSGIETVKVIVDAEKQAAKIIEEAVTEASAIRKRIDSLIQQQRQQMLAEAKKEAAAIAARAGEEGRLEAEQYERQAIQTLEALVVRASAKKDATVEKLVTIMMRVE
jgi:F0F1-type ATP synthase membrane subunit b/b'